MRRHISIIIAFLSASVLIGCSAQRHVVPVEETSHDTLFQGQTHYDSICIDRWHTTYQKADTVFVETTKLEYRYKLLRDTVYRASRDSVPVIREVEVVREVRHVPWLAKALAVLGVLFMVIVIFRIIRTCRQDLLK